MPRRPAAASTPTRAAPGTRGEATRSRLLDAGVEEFSQRGFHATRVDDIVRRARTSHGTFYLYFASKDARFEQVEADVARRFQDLTATLPDLGPTVADALAARIALPRRRDLDPGIAALALVAMVERVNDFLAGGQVPRTPRPSPPRSRRS